MEILQHSSLVVSNPVFAFNNSNNNTMNKKTSVDIERPKLKINRFVSSAQGGSFKRRESLKTAPPRYNFNSVKSKAAKALASKQAKQSSQQVNPSNIMIRNTIRERQIKDWAFKKLNVNDMINSNESLNKSRAPATKPKHEIWFDEDDMWQSGAKQQIDLAVYDDPDEEADFYRKHRNSGMNQSKADAEKNILYKLLDSKLLELSKDRYKLMSYVDYQKKIFIKKQLLKSKSLPGLKCLALEENLPREDMDEYKSTARSKVSQNKAQQIAEDRAKSKTSFKSNNSTNFRFSFNNNQPKTAQTTTTTNTHGTQFKTDENKNDDTESHLKSNSLLKANSSNVNGFVNTKKLSINFVENTSYENKKYLKKESMYRLAYKNPHRSTATTHNTEHDNNKDAPQKIPVIDYRFDNLISIIKPSYTLKEMKDVNKIIEKNEALKSTNLNAEVREKMKKVKQHGTKLANTAKEIIASGEYLQY